MQAQVTLDSQAQAYIAGLLENNRFDSIDAAVNSILKQRFEEETILKELGFRSQAEMERFDAALKVGINQIERGEVSPLDWDEINRMADEMLANKTLYTKTDSAALPPFNH